MQLSGTVSLVGAGPGSPDLITVRGLKRLREAEVVVYDALIHPELLEQIHAEAERVYAGKRGYCVGSTLQETICDVLANRAEQGLRVVRLKGGDPCVFGRGGEEAEFLAERGIEVEIVPGVTTAVGACAAAGIPLTHRDAGQSVALITGHFDPASPECTHDWAALAKMSTLVVYMGLRHLDAITAKLVEAGMNPFTPAAVIANATLPNQIVIDSALSLIADESRDLPAPAILIVGEVVGSLRQPLAVSRLLQGASA